MAKGGARPGAGRPKGSTHKPQIRDYFSKEEIEAYVEEWKVKAQNSERVFIALGEQIFGKPRQNLGLDGGDEGQPISVEVSEAIARKNGLTDDPHTLPESNS